MKLLKCSTSRNEELILNVNILFSAASLLHFGGSIFDKTGSQGSGVNVT